MARAGLPHLGNFPFAEVDDIVAHPHRFGLDLRVHLQMNGRVHRVLNRNSGDRRSVASHQDDTVRTKPVRKIITLCVRCHQQVGIAEFVAYIPDWNLGSYACRDMKERS